AADDTCRTAYPFPYRIAAVAEGARLELDVYGRAVDPDVVGGRSRGCRRRAERQVRDRGRGGGGAGGPGARHQRSFNARSGRTASAGPPSAHADRLAGAARSFRRGKAGSRPTRTRTALRRLPWDRDRRSPGCGCWERGRGTPDRTAPRY